MTFRTRLKDPGTLIRIGLVFMILAGLSHWFLRPTDFPEDLIDGLKGFLYGVAISCMLLGIWRSRHRPKTNGRIA